MSTGELKALDDKTLLEHFQRAVTLDAKDSGNGQSPYDTGQLAEELSQRLGIIQQLINQVMYATPLTEDDYPALGQLSGRPKENFIIGHSLRHLSKSVGAMHGMIEESEHGGIYVPDDFKRKITAAMFSLLKLCSVMGITGDELARGVKSMADDILYEKNLAVV